jgi:hypothetical protein
VLLTAFGYDYVPGNLAGALALKAAGPAAARGTCGLLRAREHAEGGKRRHPRIGSRVLLEPGYSFRGGRAAAERTAARVASFEIDGSRRQAFSIGSSEHFALPRLRRQPPLTDVGVYLGRFGAATGLVHYASALATPLGRLKSCPRGPGSAGPPDSAQPGHASQFGHGRPGSVRFRVIGTSRRDR